MQAPDFPADDRQLISAVRLRATRFRSLAEQINRDSLTGLLNHVAFKLQLDAELSRTSRDGSLLSIAMLDIDHFKQINDSYGHPVGDRIIRSLAMLLRKRLRGSDLIGRYGGEEFAVAMPGTDMASCIGVLEEIREQFARIMWNSGQRDFSCTVSIGVAGSTGNTTLDSLIRAADNALYVAKRSGRTRLESATGA